jgi:hypothetical protein
MSRWDELTVDVVLVLVFVVDVVVDVSVDGYGPIRSLQ